MPGSGMHFTTAYSVTRRLPPHTLSTGRAGRSVANSAELFFELASLAANQWINMDCRAIIVSKAIQHLLQF